MNKEVKRTMKGPTGKIAELKQKISDPQYMDQAIKRIAAELTVFLCR
jgi:hypothetical protein